jgi:predicted alpha-1,2-mannosidase
MSLNLHTPLFLAGLFINAVSMAQNIESKRPVNPFIGTAGHGHTFPGATTPFGMVQVSPDTDDAGWDWSSGYHYGDSTIMGFSHTHLSGTGISDLADILLMPYCGKIELQAGKKDGQTVQSKGFLEERTSSEGYRSKFSHADEKAEPGYYSVLLKKHGIKAELTAAAHTGFHRYTFPQSDSAHVIVDLLHGLDRHRTWLTERVLDAHIFIKDSVTIEGWRISSGWANVQPIYFTMAFSKPFARYGTALHDVFRENSRLSRGRNVKAVVSFQTKAGEAIEVAVGISAYSIEDAYHNRAHESAFRNFDFALKKAQAEWQKVLNVIDLETNDQKLKTTFYTALYHHAIAPNKISSGGYFYPEQLARPFDSAMRQATNIYFGAAYQQQNESQAYMSTLSLWDTYRAAHGLLILSQPKIAQSVLNSLYQHSLQSGYLPVWTLWGNEVNCMIGTPSVPIVAESILKDLEKLDSQTQKHLYHQVKQSLTTDNPVAPWSLFDKYGYVPNDKGENFTVSKTLEMCYANGCAALLAQKYGDTEGVKFFKKRAQYYRNLFDPSIGFFRGKDSHGNWTPNFDPAVTNEKDFVEATPWQYLFHVQHDVGGMIQLFGGKDSFAAKLDSLFTAQKGKIDAHILDITGLIGQYAHGNEPSHHVAYLYNYVGQSWKTQARIRQICHQFYTDQVDGLCGNEDCGQMSAWYIFSVMGFYPVHPASGRYDLGVPMVERTVLNGANGKKFEIVAQNFGAGNDYVQRVLLNGVELKEPFLEHAAILRGGKLVFEMSATPNFDLYKK